MVSHETKLEDNGAESTQAGQKITENCAQKKPKEKDYWNEWYDSSQKSNHYQAPLMYYRSTSRIINLHLIRRNAVHWLCWVIYLKTSGFWGAPLFYTDKITARRYPTYCKQNFIMSIGLAAPYTRPIALALVPEIAIVLIITRLDTPNPTVSKQPTGISMSSRPTDQVALCPRYSNATKSTKVGWSSEMYVKTLLLQKDETLRVRTCSSSRPLPSTTSSTVAKRNGATTFLNIAIDVMHGWTPWSVWSHIRFVKIYAFLYETHAIALEHARLYEHSSVYNTH